MAGNHVDPVIMSPSHEITSRGILATRPVTIEYIQTKQHEKYRSANLRRNNGWECSRWL
jgi:hypothetical protein